MASLVNFLPKDEKGDDDAEYTLPDERDDVVYAEAMLYEFDQQPFYHKYWGRRRTESFKHSAKII